MTYIEQAYNSIFVNESLLYESLLDHMEVESDFIYTCIENNIITEAVGSNIGERWKAFVERIKEFFKNLFNSFKKKGEELFKVNEKWITENINKVDNIDYTGLNAEVIPFWNMSTDDINKILDELSLTIKNIPSDTQLEKLNDKSAIENSPPFDKYTKNGESFKDGLQKCFMVGIGKKLDKVTIEDNDLGNKCKTTFRDYVVEYKSDIMTKLQAKINKMNQSMDAVTNLLKASSTNVTESFCLLENCAYADTELRYCSNFKSLLEAENGNQDDKDKPNVRSVEVTDDNNPKDGDGGNDFKNKSSAQLSYLQNVISLNQIALATAMTVYETKFSVYLKVLKSVVNARAKTTTKKAETENTKESFYTLNDNDNASILEEGLLDFKNRRLYYISKNENEKFNNSHVFAKDIKQALYWFMTHNNSVKYKEIKKTEYSSWFDNTSELVVENKYENELNKNVYIFSVSRSAFDSDINYGARIKNNDKLKVLNVKEIKLIDLIKQEGIKVTFNTMGPSEISDRKRLVMSLRNRFQLTLNKPEYSKLKSTKAVSLDLETSEVNKFTNGNSDEISYIRYDLNKFYDNKARYYMNEDGAKEYEALVKSFITDILKDKALGVISIYNGGDWDDGSYYAMIDPKKSTKK